MSNKFRYPGVNYFKSEDQDVFKGRLEDIQKLFTQLMLNKTTVLHSESGLGKSSLMEAGLIPEIIKNSSGLNYLPVIIRLDSFRQESLNSRMNILSFIEKISHQIKHVKGYNKTVIPFIDDYTNNYNKGSLWLMAKKLQVCGYRFVLILDQFEVLQTFSLSEIRLLKLQLAELLSDDLPEKVHLGIKKEASVLLNSGNAKEEDKLLFEQNVAILEKPLMAKALFVIREDKLGVMSLLADYFPDILKNDYILRPLSHDDAYDALTLPASIKGNYKSPAFEFENREIAENIINSIADAETGLVDPLQLQIIARNLERNIVINGNKTVLKQEDIPNLENIIAEQYLSWWEEVKSEFGFTQEQLEACKYSIIPHLIMGDRRELAAPEKFQMNGVPYKVISKLVELGFLREIPFAATTLYQLCHDRFIEPVKADIQDYNSKEKAREAEKEARIRAERTKNQLVEKAKKEKSRLILWGSFAVLLAFIGYIVINNSFRSKELKAEKYITIIKQLQRTNPTFSYVMAQRFNKQLGEPDNMEKVLAGFNNSKYTFQTGMYPLSERVIDVTKDEKDKTLKVIDAAGTTTWDNKSFIIKHYDKSPKRYMKKVGIQQNGSNKEVFLTVNEEYVEMCDGQGNVEKKFANVSDEKNIDLSRNGEYLIIGSYVYRTSNPEKPFATLPEYEKLDTYDQAATMFLSDNKHIAIGYLSGYKAIFRIDGNHKKKIRLAIAFPPVGGSGVRSLVADESGKFLYAGTQNNLVEVWSLDKLATSDFDSKIAKDPKYLQETQKQKQVQTLIGHSGPVTCLAISPNNKFLVSGSSTDSKAIIWNCKSWKMLSTIKNRQSVVQVGFIDNNNLYTATEDGFLCIWSREKPGLLYGRNEISDFSPFDYHNAGLEDSDIKFDDIYDRSTTQKQYSNLLHYIASIPASNQYPDDEAYMDNLKQALSDIETMYENLIRKPDYSKVISVENKRILHKLYYHLKFREPDLLVYLSEDQTMELRLKNYAQMIDVFKIDTTSIDKQTAMEISGNLGLIANMYMNKVEGGIEIAENAEKAYQVANQRKVFIENILIKFDFKNELSICNGNLSYYAIFNKKYKEAIGFANTGIELSPSNDWIYTNLALGYLMSNDFARAEDIYIRFKDLSYSNSFKDFRDAFLEDFDALEKAGIISKKNPALYKEVQKIRKMLKYENEG